jgi:hypothetical protein
MRRKLMLLSALTCVVGGSALLAPTPATSQSTLPSCESMLHQPCTTQYLECTRRLGGTDWLVCWQGGYAWA